MLQNLKTASGLSVLTCIMVNKELNDSWFISNSLLSHLIGPLHRFLLIAFHFHRHAEAKHRLQEVAHLTAFWDIILKTRINGGRWPLTSVLTNCQTHFMVIHWNTLRAMGAFAHYSQDLLILLQQKVKRNSMCLSLFLIIKYLFMPFDKFSCWKNAAML